MIPAWFTNLNPILQALLGTLFTWGVTAIGAAMVFFLSPSIARFLIVCWGLPRV